MISQSIYRFFSWELLFNISLNRDKAIIVSCQESSTDQNNDWQPEFSGEWGARVWFPDIMKVSLVISILSNSLFDVRPESSAFTINIF